MEGYRKNGSDKETECKLGTVTNYCKTVSQGQFFSKHFPYSITLPSTVRHIWDHHCWCNYLHYVWSPLQNSENEHQTNITRKATEDTTGFWSVVAW